MLLILRTSRWSNYMHASTTHLIQSCTTSSGTSRSRDCLPMLRTCVPAMIFVRTVNGKLTRAIHSKLAARADKPLGRRFACLVLPMSCFTARKVQWVVSALQFLAYAICRRTSAETYSRTRRGVFSSDILKSQGVALLGLQRAPHSGI